MNTAVTVLIILFIMMLVLMLNLLFHKQPQTAPDGMVVMPVSDLLDEPDDPEDDSFFPDDPLFAEEPEQPKEPEKSEEPETAQQKKETMPAELMDAESVDEHEDDLLFDQDILDELLGEYDPDFANKETEEPVKEIEFDQPEEPVQPEKQRQPELTADDPYRYQTEPDEDDPYDQVFLLRQGVRIAWPDSDVMMISTSFKGSVLYIWQGLSKSNEMILFDVHEKELGYPLLEAARRISDMNLKPADRFAFLIHTDDIDEAGCRQNAADFLRAERMVPAMVISDYAQQFVNSGILSEYEMISVGTSPHMILQTQAAEDTVKKILQMSLKYLKDDHVNETAVEAFSRMKKHLPLGSRTGLNFGMNTKKAARKASEKIPGTQGWVNPSFKTSSAEGVTTISLSAPDEVCLENTMNEFRENMRRNQLTFRVIRHVHGTAPASVNDDAFIRIEKAYSSAGFTRTLIPVLSEEEYTIRGIRTLSIPSRRMDRRSLDQLLMKVLLGE